MARKKNDVDKFNVQPDSATDAAASSLASKMQRPQTSSGMGFHGRTKAQGASLRKKTILETDVENIHIGEFANRFEQFFEGDEFEEFCTEIERRGQLTPILVRPHPNGLKDQYELIFGRKRLEACRRLGIKVRFVVRDTSLKELIVIQETENLKRSDINFYERGYSYMKAIEAGIIKNAKEVTELFDLTKTAVSMHLSIAKIDRDLVFAVFDYDELQEDFMRRMYDFSVLYKRVQKEDAELFDKFTMFVNENEWINVPGLSAKAKVDKLISFLSNKPAPTASFTKETVGNGVVLKKYANGKVTLELSKKVDNLDEITEKIKEFIMQEMK